jgi:hypothetical protein
LVALVLLAFAFAGSLAAVGIAAAEAAGPGEYSSPEAWPLRGSNLVGCAKDSPGPICGGTYHPSWAIDVEAPQGQEIYASGAGLAKVYTNTTACSNYGRSVVIEHGGSVKSLYGHMSNFSADIAANPLGVWVDENTVIGYVGHTGNVSNCSYNHLHYEETTNGSLDTSATDPGPLRACVGGSLRSYPAYWGQGSWDGLPGHTLTAASDAANCAPQPPAKPSCTAVSETTVQDVPKAIRLMCSGEAFTYTAPSAPAHGTILSFDAGAGTLTYTPAAGYTGPDSFTFGASNAGGNADAATVTITVLPPKPVCAPVTAPVSPGNPTAVQLTCTGQAISYTAPSAPAHGTISAFNAMAGTLTYTPAAGYAGPDSFTFGASNAGGTSEPSTATMTVLPPKPVCAPVTALVATSTPTAMQLTCTGQAISYTAPSAPAHGTISAFNATTGTLTYTPATGYKGPDSFTFAAANTGGAADPATVTVTIATPPLIRNLRATSKCVRMVRLKSTPTRGSGGLSFSYTLNQTAQVFYEIYRRDDSAPHKHCPKNATGHTQDTFTPQGNLTGPGKPGPNPVVVARSASGAGAAIQRAPLRQSLRAGGHRVSLAQVTKGRLLAPGTYILLVSATNTRGQRSTTAHVKFFALGNRPSVLPGPVILPAPKAVQAGKAAALEIIPPSNARVCAASIGQGSRKTRHLITPSGPSRMLTWTVGENARGTWPVRITCGTKQQPASLGSAETTIVVQRGGKPSGRLVRRGSFHVNAGLIPAKPGRVGGFQRRITVPDSAPTINTDGWQDCSPSAWMTKVHNVGYGLGQRQSFLPTARAKKFARITPGAYDRMWGDLQRCLGNPAVAVDELDTLYAQMVCHAVYGFQGAEPVTGNTWDFEAWHKPVPWNVSLNPLHKCGHWGDVETGAVGKQLNNRIVQSDADTNPQKMAWLVQQEKGKWVRQHIKTQKAYFCLTNAGKVGAEPYPAEFLDTYLPLGAEITDSVCPAPPAGDGGNPGAGPGGNPGAGPGGNPGPGPGGNPGGGDGTGGCNGAGGTSAGGPGRASFHVQDIFYGGTWARTDPCTGAWFTQSARPANGAYWYPNGLGVGVDCARTGAAYTVRFADGHSETWATWFHVTDGKWFPSAAARETFHDGFYGLPAC